MGRAIKKIVQEHNVAIPSLNKENMEALQLFEKHVQVKENKAVEWRPLQRDMLEYVNNPTQRTIIWVVGEKGNEGKTFFQDKIEQHYGEHGVFQMGLNQSTRDMLRIMKKYVNMQTDIFLFNITRSTRPHREHYKLLESIKDGSAIPINFKVQKMRFTTPNVLIVFFYQRT